MTPCGLPGGRRVARRWGCRGLAHRAHRREQSGGQRGDRARSTSSVATAPSSRPRGAASPSRPATESSSRSTPWPPARPAPAVHVIATGGVVSAVLSDQWIDGATARGIDDSVPAAAPATTQVLAGLDVAGRDLPAAAQPDDRGGGARQGDGADRAGSAPARRAACRPRAAGRHARRAPRPRMPAPTACASAPTDPSPAPPGPSAGPRAADRMGDFAWLPGDCGGAWRGGSRAARPRRRDASGSCSPPARRAARSGRARDRHRAAHRSGGRQARTRRRWSTSAAPTACGSRSAAATCGRRSRSSEPTAGVPQVAAVPLTSAPVTSVSVPVRQVGS